MPSKSNPINSAGSRADDLQTLIDEIGHSGWVYLPEGEYEIGGNLGIHQPFITILGDGRDRTKIIGEGGEMITVTRENTIIQDLTIQGTNDEMEDGIVFKGVSQRCVLNNLRFRGIGRYSVYRPEYHASGLNIVSNCVFEKIGVAGIRAEGGSGALNVVAFNKSDNKELTLAEWGVNNSILTRNQGKIVLTPSSANNHIYDENSGENVDDKSQSNIVTPIS